MEDASALGITLRHHLTASPYGITLRHYRQSIALGRAHKHRGAARNNGQPPSFSHGITAPHHLTAFSPRLLLY
ncbi:MAG: hypothetical protein FWC64_09565 [Treponema sp.]|nr:hypothetical protein [Treponema sp.]